MVSVSLAGQPFSAQHHFFLSAWCRARGYIGSVWVAAPMVTLLQLSLRSDADTPVRLEAANGCCFYYHSSQFSESLESLKAKWAAFVADQRQKKLEARTSKYPEHMRPLTTNGEFFPLEVEEKMVAMMSCSSEGRYWATKEEASYIFQSPFPEAVLSNAAAGVAVPHPLSDVPLMYYRTCLSRDPSKYSSESCKRYDPYNYRGCLYKPITSVQLKRAAIAQHCLGQQRWMTPWRVRVCGSRLLPGVKPVAIRLYNGDRVVELVNIACTSNPQLLEAKALSLASSISVAESPPKSEDDHLVIDDSHS